MSVFFSPPGPNEISNYSLVNSWTLFEYTHDPWLGTYFRGPREGYSPGLLKNYWGRPKRFFDNFFFFFTAFRHAVSHLVKSFKTFLGFVFDRFANFLNTTFYVWHEYCFVFTLPVKNKKNPRETNRVKIETLKSAIMHSDAKMLINRI